MIPSSISIKQLHYFGQMLEFQTVCKVDEIPPGAAKVFMIEGRPIGIYHIGNEFFALDDRCPHAGASLVRGQIEGDVIRCRIHHWGFCIRNGVYVDQDQPSHNAESFDVRIQGDHVQLRR